MAMSSFAALQPPENTSDPHVPPIAHDRESGVREFNLGATPEGRALYRSQGFVDYPAEMRRRV